MIYYSRFSNFYKNDDFYSVGYSLNTWKFFNKNICACIAVKYGAMFAEFEILSNNIFPCQATLHYSKRYSFYIAMKFVLTTLSFQTYLSKCN